MGYDRNDRFGSGQDHRYGGRAPDRDEGYRGQDQGRRPQGFRDEDRGFLDRAGDEVRSWFGDEDAERRRRRDEGDQGYRERQFGGHDRTSDDRGYRVDNRPDGPDDRSRARQGQFGAGVPSGARDGWNGRGSDEQRNHDHDPGYRSWRDRQMEAFDRDYHEYRRENQSRFDAEFGAWRQNREKQRGALGQVREHQEVVGSDGAHVGTVDKVKGDRILLTKNDQEAGGHHHSIPVGWIQSVGDKVEISKTAAQAQAAWRDEDRARAGEDDDTGPDGPHVLNRSFSGTY